MGSRSKNSTKKKVVTSTRLEELEEALFSGFIRYEAMFQILVKKGIMTEEDLNNELNLIYNQTQELKELKELKAEVTE